MQRNVLLHLHTRDGSRIDDLHLLGANKPHFVAPTTMLGILGYATDASPMLSFSFSVSLSYHKRPLALCTLQNQGACSFIF